MDQLVAPFAGRCMAVLLWGSRARGDETDRSDTDLCIVAGPEGDLRELQGLAFRVPADLHVFERMPDFLKAEVLRAHQLLWGDAIELAEYLRPYWKRWRTQAARQALTEDEARAIVKRAAHAG